QARYRRSRTAGDLRDDADAARASPRRHRRAERDDSGQRRVRHARAARPPARRRAGVRAARHRLAFEAPRRRKDRTARRSESPFHGARAMTTLAFFGDRNVVPALHVAIASTLGSWLGPEPLEIHLFHRDITPADLALMRKTAAL